MPVVKAVFFSEEDAGRALEALRSHFEDHAISMALYRVSRGEAGDADRYDPADAARLAGTPVNTLASTGANLVGNSTTLDVRLGELPAILEAAARDEERSQGRRTGARIEASVECSDEADVETAKELLQESGGKKVRVEHRR